MTTNVIVRTSFAATHHWPECPIQEVAFLRHPHRHVFHIVAKKTVSHANRDVEFIVLKRLIDEFLATLNGELNDRSCEHLAYILINRFALCYCEVNEDGENGAEVWA